MSEPITELLVNFVTLPVISTLTKNSIAEKLQDGPKTAEELCISTSMIPSKLFRYLRLASVSGYFAVDSNKRWSNTPKSLVLTSQFTHKVCNWLGNPLVSENFLHTDIAIRTENDARLERNKPIFFEEIFQNPQLLEAFQTLMTEITSSTLPIIANALDVKGAKSVLDIGGADGSLSVEISKKFQDAKVSVFDRAEVRPIFEGYVAAQGLSGKIDFVSGNFFESIPDGYDSIVMKHIIHDWDDEKALVILKNCRNALKENSRIFVIDKVIDQNSPFYIATVSMDISMMMCHNGQERTLEQFSQLFSHSGFKLVSTTQTADEFIIEAQAIN